MIAQTVFDPIWRLRAADSHARKYEESLNCKRLQSESRLQRAFISCTAKNILLGIKKRKRRRFFFGSCKHDGPRRLLDMKFFILLCSHCCVRCFPLFKNLSLECSIQSLALYTSYNLSGAAIPLNRMSRKAFLFAAHKRAQLSFEYS